VQLDPSTSVVSVGAGARSQSVYEALDPYNLSAQVGRNGDVGVGGFLTGGAHSLPVSNIKSTLLTRHSVGGIGFLSPERGWACDSVVNFEIVLSSGEIVDANATSHSDLFTALKGGTNNFGIVTRFDLKTYVQGPLWGGVIVYSDTTDEQLLSTIVDFKSPDNFDPNAMFTFGFTFGAAQGTFAAEIALYHSRPEKVQGSMFESFTKIQPQLLNSLRMGSPGSFAGEKLLPVVKPV
jgi:FAD/FMN-containing dehydrogenase